LLQKRPTALFEKINPLKWFLVFGWILPAGIVGVWVWAMLNQPDGKFACFGKVPHIDVSRKIYIRFRVNFLKL